MLIREQVSGFVNKVYRTPGGIWAPLFDVFTPKHQNVLAILGRPDGKVLIPAHNIITNAGDVYYAERMAAETPTNTFNSCYLSSVEWDATHPQKASTATNIASMISGVEKLVSATYPKTNDGDADNTGAGTDITSWLFSWTKADFNDADIDAGAVTVAGHSTWGSGGQVLLAAFDMTTFAKTANDTLKLFVNHTANGV